MGRAPADFTLKRGTWSPEEDHKLIAYINRYRIWNWNYMAKFAGLSRSGKSCRLRWMNYLRPNIRHGNFSKAEEEIIIKMQQQIGNRWAVIASRLPGRTDNEIKNYWNTHFRKQTTHKSTTTSLIGAKTLNKNLPKISDDCKTLPAETNYKPSNTVDLEFEGMIPISSSPQVSNLSYSSWSSSSIDQSDIDTSTSNEVVDMENTMDLFEYDSFIELGSLWEKPTFQITAPWALFDGDGNWQY